MAVAHYDASSTHALNRCQWIPGVDFADPSLLKQQIDSWGLVGCPASVVLSPGSYQLILVEAPAVDPAELKEALRWRIKDLVSYDIAAASIDYFHLPEDAYHGRSKMVYAVVMPLSLSAKIEAFSKAAGLRLDTIDIPEMALMNLIALHDPDSSLGKACLYLQEPTCYINLVSEKALYLTRNFEIPAGAIDADDEQAMAQAGGMVLDVQRSLDYYESQIGKPPCVKLLVCPLQAGETPLISQFRHNLGVELEQLDLAELLSCREPLSPELQSQTLIAVAAALRQEGEG